MEKVYDMLVIGGGPAGYTAALYAARAGLDVLVLERLCAGGQMALTHKIDNYPGFPSGIDGFTLGENMRVQAHRFGVQTQLTRVTGAQLRGAEKLLHTDDGDFRGKTVVIATGADPRPLGLAEEREFLGRGVHYCAACDGSFYRGKDVVVVGGGNTAAADALLLGRIAKSVVVVHRRDSLRAEKIYARALLRAENIEICWNSVVTALLSEGRFRGVRLKNLQDGEEKELHCDGLFVSVGRVPATAFLEGQIPLDENGYIPAGETTETALEGVFAVGDVRTKELRQVVTAVADGAVAAHRAEAFLVEHT